MAWANDVRFHVSRNLLYLRRFRGMSQARLAAAIGASQSQIARIESGDENVTMTTVERIVNALDGRFEVRIAPAEFKAQARTLWWEQPTSTSTTTRWTLDVIETRETDDRREVRVTFGADIQRPTLESSHFLITAATH
ncbi:MAG: helix-turn-helix transcriptional regulator [Candidatus Binatia bacterium]